MSAFGNSSLNYYSSVERQEVNILPASDGVLCVDADDRPVGQPYNNFIISNRGVLLAGKFNAVKVTECNFPYLIPNVNDNNNFFTIGYTPDGATLTYYVIDIPNGYYTPQALATKVTELIQDATSDTNLECTYAPATLSFTIATTTVGAGFYVMSALVQPSQSEPVQSLLRLMNFPTTPGTAPPVATATGFPTTLQYTKYIDFTSDTLTQYQDMNDTSTARLNKRHIFCRLYIADEISTASVDGSGNPIFPGLIPFIIHRQFKTPKTLKWNGKDSIDRIDIQAYDDTGEPLATLPGMPGFQFTFECSE